MWLLVLSHCAVLLCRVEGLSHLLRKDKQRQGHGSGISYRLLTTRTAFAPRAIDVEFVVGKVALLSVLPPSNTESNSTLMFKWKRQVSIRS